MRIDYHMHFEYGSYDPIWVKLFFDTAKSREIDEIGISEHTHGFTEFKSLYYDEMILDESKMGTYQKKWLATNKFKYSLKDYEKFINFLKNSGYPVKFGLELCNFQNQERVKEIIKPYTFDYLIASIHFIEGWAFDLSELKERWDSINIYEMYEKNVVEIEKVCATGLYDVLGHPFNLRMYKYFPEKSVDSLLERAVKAMKKANMVVDVNTGNFYRYPIKEIAPYSDFMKYAKAYELPIIFSSDAHRPEHVGIYISEAMDYAKSFGYNEFVVFDKRDRKMVKF